MAEKVKDIEEIRRAVEEYEAMMGVGDEIRIGKKVVKVRMVPVGKLEGILKILARFSFLLERENVGLDRFVIEGFQVVVKALLRVYPELKRRWWEFWTRKSYLERYATVSDVILLFEKTIKVNGIENFFGKLVEVMGGVLGSEEKKKE